VGSARNLLSFPPNARSLLAQYAVALTVVGLALGARWLLNPMLGDRLPFVTAFMVLLPLVILVRPGPFLAASLLAWAGTLYLFVPPKLSFRMEGTSSELQALLFGSAVIAATVTAWLSSEARRRNQQALHNSEAQFRAIVHNALDGIITINEQGVIESANPAAERLFGYSAVELVGQKIGILMPESYRDQHHSYLDSYVRTGDREAIGIGRELTGERRDGTYFDMELAVSELHLSNQRMFTGVVRDITERKRIESERAEHAQELVVALDKRTREVIQAEKGLASAERMAAIGGMASGLAHDINNILLPLSGRLDDLLGAEKLPAVMRADLVVVVALVDHLRAMSRNLSLFARDPAQEGTEGSTELAEWSGRTRRLLEASLASVQARGSSRPVQLESDIPDGLPPVGVAPHRLTQAVLNLVHNARDAIVADTARARSRDGLGHIRLQARVLPEHSVVTLKVIDNGCGMDGETMRRSVEPFFTTKDRGVAGAGSGSGLGLSLAQAICGRVGGRLEIESELDKGTTITMFLPIAGPGAPAVTGCP
jgi:two-component system, LuxR family, sensor kinase FixL